MVREIAKAVDRLHFEGVEKRLSEFFLIISSYFSKLRLDTETISLTKYGKDLG